jgi:hypothetical protein
MVMGHKGQTGHIGQGEASLGEAWPLMAVLCFTVHAVDIIVFKEGMSAGKKG